MDRRDIINEIATYFETPITKVKKVAWNTFGYAKADGNIVGVGFYAQFLTSFPQEVLNLDSLEVLSLTGGGLKKLPPEIGGLANLRELYIGGNEIKVIPREIGGLQKLEVLYILED